MPRVGEETTDAVWGEVPSIATGAMVVVHCQSPKEKLWGLLLRLDSVGVVIRGLDLNSVDEWIRQQREMGSGLISPSTQFVPMHRLERIYLDEPGSGFEGYGQRYASLCGGDVRRALIGADEPDA
jgi:hypothetical protein